MRRARIDALDRLLARWKAEYRLRRLRAALLEGRAGRNANRGRFWEGSLDRLGDYLGVIKRKVPMNYSITVPADKPLIIMTRSFDAPRKLVWKVWTDPVHVARWWGPRRMTTKVVKLDLRPGGTWRFEHHGPDGDVYIFKGTFLEVIEPEKLVNTFGMEGMFEDKLLVETHTFEEVDGKTNYKSVSRFDSLEDRDGMLQSGMEEGAKESMERVDELLAELQEK